MRNDSVPTVMANEPCPTILCGLGFGDEGKGSFVDAWARRQDRAPLVVRYNGGPQAAHHVVIPDGTVHCFAQLGSGMFRPDVSTLLSPFMLVEPLLLLKEAQQLASLGVPTPLERTIVSRRCIVVTPFHKLVGQLRELARGAARHGSCGLGVGQAWLDGQNPSIPSLHIEDLTDRTTLSAKLRFLQLVKVDQAEQLLDGMSQPVSSECLAILTALSRRSAVSQLCEGYGHFRQSGVRLGDDSQLAALLSDEQQPLLFEGAQGALLDATFGFFPFVTPSCTRFDNARTLLSGRKAQTYGILRAYATRHGPGPLVSEDPRLSQELPDAHNRNNPWQGPMRVGWFDAVAMRYALAVVGGVDRLAISCLDRLVQRGPLKLCRAYRYQGPAATDLDDLFVRSSDGTILDIRVPQQPTLTQQAQLGLRLTLCQPVYDELPAISSMHTRDGQLSRDAQTYLSTLLSELRLSDDQLGYVSTGPTAQDKLWR
ncbi:MAG: adenylosuccinate synthetase [Myxococcales bacterium]|nr:adenylosuccinate synthetase [Myxococcales bacterium]